MPLNQGWYQEGPYSINIFDGRVYKGRVQIGQIDKIRGNDTGTLTITESSIDNNQIAEIYRIATIAFDRDITINRGVNTPRGLGYIDDSGRVVRGEKNEAGEVVGTIETLEDSITEAAEQRNEEEEARFNTGLQELGALRGRSLQGLNNLGNQARADVNREYEGLAARTNQNLIDRGLHNTTIAPSVQAGITRGKAGELARIGENVRQQQIGTDIDLTKAIENFRVNRTDTPIDSQLLSELFRLQAAGGNL